MGLASTGLILLLIHQPKQYPIELLPPPTPGPLSIHVAGAAERPGVYLLPRGSIVQEALDAAGGPTSSADLDRINLAADLEDGQRVYVPKMTALGTSTGEEIPAWRRRSWIIARPMVSSTQPTICSPYRGSVRRKWSKYET